MIITIDGLSATGKTTIARRVAEKLGWRYFDTGAMYRAVTYSLLKQKISLDDRAEVEKFLGSFAFDIRTENSKPHYYVDGEEVTEEIRSPEVNQEVSKIAAHASIREALLTIQRKFGSGQKVVFEGRDMGTTVFPKAELKIFLTARSSVRAERRYLELKEKHPTFTEEEVLENLLARDKMDSSRKTSPLQQAEDAHLIDTSDLNIDEVVARILTLVPLQRGQ